MEKPKRINFTKGSLEAIKPDKTKRVVVHDSKTEGLILRVEPSGKRTFCWLRKADGRVQFKKIGTFPDITPEQARGEAAKHNASLAKWSAGDFSDDNPFVRQKTTTVSEVADLYIDKQIRLGNSTDPVRREREIRGMLDSHLAIWKARRLRSIKRGEITSWHTEIGKKHGKVTANRSWELLRTIFNWAIKNGHWAGDNPARIMKDDRFKEYARDKYITEEQMPNFLKVLATEPNRDLRDFVIISLFTGARRGDVLNMRWDQINGNVWTVPNRKKPEHPYVVRLEQEVLDQLEDRKNDSEWVFPSHSESGHLESVKRGWKEFLKRAKLTDIRVHDLRRTLGSWQANQGVSLEIIGKSLGHRDSRSTKRYAQLQNQVAHDSVHQATRAMLAAKEKDD